MLQSSIKAVNMTAPCFTKATKDLTSFMATNPFQAGFRHPAQTGAGSSAGMLANGKAAMELQGDWEPSVVPGPHLGQEHHSPARLVPVPAGPRRRGSPDGRARRR